MESDFISRIIYDLLFLDRSPASKTEEFKGRKHNDDLVPSFNNKINDIITLFERYHKLSYDTQGIRDNGVDVLLRYQSGEADKYIGFQIKSYDDLEEKNWLTKLKAQITDAKNHYNLTDYYIIFCTNAELHRQKMRDASADISRIKDSYVITPQNALGFLQLPGHRIGAYLKRKLSVGDEVVLKAQGSLAGYSLGQSAFFIEAMAQFVETGQRIFSSDVILYSSFVNEVYDNYPNLSPDLFEYDDADLEDIDWDEEVTNKADEMQSLCIEGTFELQIETDFLIFHHDLFFPIMAIISEARTRYEYDWLEVRRYAFDLLKEPEIEIAWKLMNIKQSGKQS